MKAPESRGEQFKKEYLDIKESFSHLLLDLLKLLERAKKAEIKFGLPETLVIGLIETISEVTIKRGESQAGPYPYLVWNTPFTELTVHGGGNFGSTVIFTDVSGSEWVEITFTAGKDAIDSGQSDLNGGTLKFDAGNRVRKVALKPADSRQGITGIKYSMKWKFPNELQGEKDGNGAKMVIQDP